MLVMKCRNWSIFALVFLQLVCRSISSSRQQIHLAQPTLILVSFDGFRWDYMDRVPTPNFDFIVENGIRAKHIVNTFVTKTFPNHYTIVTGLYEESHGIVANTMYDPVFKSWFYLNNTEAKWWNAGEPIWVTNQLSGKTSGVVFWPGSEIPIRGQYPTHYMKYNGKLPFSARVDHLISLLESDYPPSFLAMYFQEPDHCGHKYGPDSKEVDHQISRADNTTGYLLESLRRRGLLDQVHLIITSDHGMTAINTSREIYLEDYISPDWYKLISIHAWDAFAHILPHEGFEEKVYQGLKGAHPHLKVYRKEEIPEEFHYKHNRRVMPIFVVGDPGWSVMKHRNLSIGKDGGNHGYSNKFKEMYPFFLAYGSLFKEGYLSEPFENVDIYPLMCHILGIMPAPNNGSMKAVNHLLKAHNQSYTVLIVVAVVSVLVFALMSYGIIIFCIRYKCKMKQYGHIYDLGVDFDL